MAVGAVDDFEPARGRPRPSTRAGPTRSDAEQPLPLTIMLWMKRCVPLQRWPGVSSSAITLLAMIGRFQRGTLPYLELMRIDPT